MKLKNEEKLRREIVALKRQLTATKEQLTATKEQLASTNWNGEEIASELNKVSEQAGHAPLYVVSDNASTMNKGINNSKLLHIRDISHSLGLYLKRIYDKDTEFKTYMKKLAQVKFKEVMTSVSYLLPPKQRTIARFMNLAHTVSWSNKILMNYKNLTADEKKTFSFVPRYTSFINELQNVLSCVHAIEQEIKQNGLSHQSSKNCMEYIKRHLSTGSKRVLKIAELFAEYLNEETKKLSSAKNCWHASSDVLESIFGVYKNRKSPNSLYGVTTYILFLPLYTRIHKKTKLNHFDFKYHLKSVFIREISKWGKEKLSENQVTKRIKALKIT